jgi:hypothetical protein
MPRIRAYSSLSLIPHTVIYPLDQGKSQVYLLLSVRFRFYDAFRIVSVQLPVQRFPKGEALTDRLSGTLNLRMTIWHQ